MNIMISTDLNYINPAKAMLFSLCESNPSELDIYLLYKGLGEGDIAELKEITDIFQGKRLHAVYMDDRLLEGVAVSKAFPIESYYRIIAPMFLPKELDRILHIDVDTIVRGELDTLYNTDLNGKLFAVCEDIPAVLNEKLNECKSRCGLSPMTGYFNSGVMLFNLEEIRRTDFVERTVRHINENREKYIYPDQDALNALFADRSLFVPWDLYNCPPEIYYIDGKALQHDEIRMITHRELGEAIRAVRKRAEGIIATAEADEGTQAADMGENSDAKAVLPDLADYIDITGQLCEGAVIIHYMGPSKPWHEGRETSKVYRMFDAPYQDVVKRMHEIKSRPDS